MEPDVLFPLFKGTPFFPPGDKAQEMVSDMLVGTYGKEYALYQWRSHGRRSRAGGWGSCRLPAWGCGGEIALRRPPGAVRPQSRDWAPLSNQNGWKARQCSAIFGSTTKGPRKI